MRRKRLFWQLFPSYLFVTFLSLIAVTWYATSSWRDFYVARLRAQLKTQAHMARMQVRQPAMQGDYAAVQEVCRQLGQVTRSRFTVILPDGIVVGDSHESPDSMERHDDRPEVQAALAGGERHAERFSRTLGKRMIYFAVPMEMPSGAHAVVRVAADADAVKAAMSNTYAKVAVSGLLVAAAAIAIGWAISRRLSRPLEDLREGAERFARGGLTQKLPMSDTLEFADLAAAMNKMAAQLDERIRTVIRQRNEQEAVLASMVEGVFAVDPEGRLISMNHAAGELLEANPEKAEGRNLQEVVRNIELQTFVERALRSPQPVAEEIVLHGAGQDYYLQAHGTVLRSEAQGEGIGALIVLHDVTQLRRLENVRREFVSNVSHELRTPITSIAGFVETLLGGAMREPEDLERFLNIIRRQVERLNHIIEDLLALSRIEQTEGQGAIELAEGPVREVLESAVQICHGQAAAKDIEIELQCPADLRAKLSTSLLEQALVNLIDNAVKYSEKGGKVRVEAQRNGAEIVLRVRDRGCGIPREHLPRVFERFYRVDKARSRKLGGTGLGLSIVKHLAQIHSGRVAVDSEPGRGSVFSIFLPATPPQETPETNGAAEQSEPS